METPRLRWSLDAPIPELPKASSLRLLTWNVVHGTRISVPPRLVPRAFVEARLDHVAALARSLEVDVLALQEADGDARLDRTQHVARVAALACAHEHASLGRGSLEHGSLRHGASLATAPNRVVVRRVETGRFVAGGWDPKGFTIGRIAIEGQELDVLSVHLSVFSAAVRRRQIDELGRSVDRFVALHGRVPLVLAGDLNDEIEGTTGALAARLALTAIPAPRPTFFVLGLARRLDWVLVSSEVRLVGHHVLGAGTSDHRAVLVDLALGGGS